MRLSRALGGPIIARGVLELLWDSCYECGDDYVGTADDIESLIGWAGDPGVVARALVDAGMPEGVGFIELVEGESARPCFRVHDLWHHAPDYVAKRHKRELQRHQKAKPVLDSHAAPNGGQRTTTPNWQNGVDRPPAPALAPAPAPAPTQQSVSPEPQGDSVPADVAPVQEAFLPRMRADDGPILLTFPTIGKDGSEWRLRRRQVDEWQVLFPGLDVLDQCRHALAWVIANPGHRKTARGMPGFLVRWFNRSVDRRPSGGGNGSERPFSERETEAAREWRRKMGGCGHTPKCENYSACVERFIRTRRGAA